MQRCPVIVQRCYSKTFLAEHFNEKHDFAKKLDFKILEKDTITSEDLSCKKDSRICQMT